MTKAVLQKCINFFNTSKNLLKFSLLSEMFNHVIKIIVTVL